jgi:choline dehydrogenase-like flavoprotein
MKVVIVGGVAGGASCAARLRRLDENAEIVMVERGPYVSYANCGLPYHVSGVISRESSLLVANEQLFRGQFSVDARTNCEAISIFAQEENRRTAQCRDRRGGYRVLRQAGAIARRAFGPSAAARKRPARNIPGENGAGRAHDPRVDRRRHDFPGGEV